MTWNAFWQVMMLMDILATVYLISMTLIIEGTRWKNLLHVIKKFYVLINQSSNTRIENHGNTDFSRHGEEPLTLLDELQNLKMGNDNSLSCRPSCMVICNDDVEPTHTRNLVKISLPDNLKRHADTCFDQETGTCPCAINLQKQLCEEDCRFTLTTNSSSCTNKQSESPICGTTPSVQLPCNGIYRNLLDLLEMVFFLNPQICRKKLNGRGFYVESVHLLLGHILLIVIKMLQLMKEFGYLSAAYQLANLLVDYMINSGSIHFKRSSPIYCWIVRSTSLHIGR